MWFAQGHNATVEQSKDKTQGWLPGQRWFHSSMKPPIHSCKECRKLSSSRSNLPALTYRSGPNPFLNPLPSRAANFPKNAAQICIKCLLCANHPVRQQECKQGKVCSFKELALMEDRDNYKEVRVMIQVSPETRDKVREDFPEECDLLNWVPWDGEQWARQKRKERVSDSRQSKENEDSEAWNDMSVTTGS